MCIRDRDEGTDDNEPIIKALNSFIGGNEVEEKKEASASQPAEEAAQGTTSELVFADFEMNAVNEALKKGLGVYEIVVTVDENCILKAARAFLVDVYKRQEYNIAIVENKPLARILYHNIDVGMEIPPELYQAVAEILAAVMKTNNRL